MSFDSGPLDRFLNSAVGDDLTVAAELHATFVESANGLADLMQRSRCDANWSMAALRLKSLAATFGVISLIQLAEVAMAGAPGDPAIVRDIRSAITQLN